jgi:hypothetical protein
VENPAHALGIAPDIDSRRSGGRRRCPRSVLAALTACLALAALVVPAGTPAAAQTAVDLELVIAVDVSLSMDVDEQRLQREGYVAAFRDADIHKAIVSGPHARIAVVYVEWAGPAFQSVVVQWTVLDGAQAARAFADRLAAVPITRARLTSISGALAYSRDMFASSGAKGIRRVIDVSGDGPNNAGLPVLSARASVLADGIVVNGLPIMLKVATSSAFDLPDLDRYYANCVIGGAGSFLVPVRALSEFKLAIRRKLLLEISAPLPSARVHPAQLDRPEEPYDCLVGEKRWHRYLNRDPF